jgi:dCTP deaminase
MTTAPTPRLFPELPREKRDRPRGVLPFEHIRALIADGFVEASDPIPDEQIQPASLDLRLGDVAYQVRASFLPGPTATVEDGIRDLLLQTHDLREGAVLHPGSVYIIPLLETLALRPSDLTARANPKSTTGRLDVFARLITDRSEKFDEVAKGYSGPLYLEVSPMTFRVNVRRGVRLNQIRFRQGQPAEFHLTTKAAKGDWPLLWGVDGEPIRTTPEEGLWFSVDLEGLHTGELVGWKARSNAPAIDVDLINHYEVAEFWEPVRRQRQIILDAGAFYILGSRERVSIPPSLAAEMVAYEEWVGELRVHYAGFFDPGFGYFERGRLQGTRAVLEVRSHVIPSALKHGQRVGRFHFEEMLAIPEKLYGEGSGSNYQDQGLGLAKQFRRD